MSRARVASTTETHRREGLPTQGIRRAGHPRGRPRKFYGHPSRPAWVAREIGRRLGYASHGKRLVSRIRREWASEFIEGTDYVVLAGEALAALKAAVDPEVSAVPRRASGLMLLTESGLHLVLTKTNKLVGVRLRRFLVHEVLPQVMRAGGYASGLDAVRSDIAFRRWLSAEHTEIARGLRRLLVEVLLDEPDRYRDADSWDANKNDFLTGLGPLFDGKALTDAADSFWGLPSESDDENRDVVGLQRHTVEVDGTLVQLKLGSIASVKGQTHDATLVVQSVTSRVKDARTALELATGKRTRSKLGPKLRRAVTNVFVGATRPRHVLCLALPAEDLTDRMRAELKNWGWRVLFPNHES